MQGIQGSASSHFMITSLPDDDVCLDNQLPDEA